MNFEGTQLSPWHQLVGVIMLGLLETRNATTLLVFPPLYWKHTLKARALGLVMPHPLTLTPCNVSHHHWNDCVSRQAGANMNGEPQRAKESHVESVKDRSHPLGFSSCCLTTNCSPKLQTKRSEGRNQQKPSPSLSLWKLNNGFLLEHFMSVMWIHVKWEHK